MIKNKKPLGRGLSAILNTHDSTDSIEVNYSQSSIGEIAIELIEENPAQPRSQFEEHSLLELADSIRQMGLIQPVTVRKIGDRFQIISGERRLRASKMAGLTSIPAYIRLANDQQLLELALVENIQREDLNAIEIAYAYQRLIEECNLNYEQLSVKVCKERSTIVNFLRLLRLPPEIQLGVIQRKISMAHARTLLSVEDPIQQADLYQKIVDENLSVRATEQESQKMKQGHIQARRGQTPLLFKVYEQRLINYFKAPVKIKADIQGKGSITLNFETEEELQQILDRISKEL